MFTASISRRSSQRYFSFTGGPVPVNMVNSTPHSHSSDLTANDSEVSDIQMLQLGKSLIKNGFFHKLSPIFHVLVPIQEVLGSIPRHRENLVAIRCVVSWYRCKIILLSSCR